MADAQLAPDAPAPAPGARGADLAQLGRGADLVRVECPRCGARDVERRRIKRPSP